MRNAILREVTTALLIATIFSVSIPLLLPSRTVYEKASPSQRSVIDRGTVSESLWGSAQRGKVITGEDIAKTFNASEPRKLALFPPDLWYDRQPDKSAPEKEDISLAQKLELLQNQLTKLRTEFDLVKPPQKWTFEWFLEQLWNGLFWVVGIPLGIILTRYTERKLPLDLNQPNRR